jgi:hypothetical protein
VQQQQATISGYRYWHAGQTKKLKDPKHLVIISPPPKQKSPLWPKGCLLSIVV